MLVICLHEYLKEDLGSWTNVNSTKLTKKICVTTLILSTLVLRPQIGLFSVLTHNMVLRRRRRRRGGKINLDFKSHGAIFRSV